MKVSNALYTYPVLSLAESRDDYKAESSFSVTVDKLQTGVKEISLSVTVRLESEYISELIKADKAKIICHVESPLSSYRSTHEINLFDLNILVPIEPKSMRGILELTPFIVATENIDDFSSDAFSEFYKGSYHIEKGDVLAFTPTVEIEIEPEDIDKRPTQSIIKVGSHDEREMTTDLTGDYILVRLPSDTYFGYKVLSRRESPHYKISLMAVILPVLMDAIYEMKTDDSTENKVWAKVIRAKLKDGGRGGDVSQYDPMIHAQFLLNNPADGTFTPIIETHGDET